ncbi:hypothetical protein TI05_19515 [Achromatium sp. WMS3]|nr:hypothetical protein TI05_19515 [Achromatium sp. WMS3]
MGFGGIGFWQLFIILIIILLVFGTNRLRNLGTDLGEAIKGFRGAMNEGGEDKNKNSEPKLEKIINHDEPPNGKV